MGADLALFFERTHFPNLRVFQLTDTFDPESPVCHPLLDFLRAHQPNLQELIIRRSENHLPPTRNWFLTYFPSSIYTFPSLRLLVIDAVPSTFITDVSQDLRLFNRTAPKLESLLVNDITVDTYYLPLVGGTTDSTLQMTRIQLTPKFLSSQIIDTLMGNTRLEELHLTYWDYGPYTDSILPSLVSSHITIDRDQAN
ncbi:hypothetical protein H0H87_011626 [Tephrocybe sp. NHM501043]|nr:hypothetical protein H0H87_011626 [Tephrocybe sp. NHM501043]